MYEDNQVHDEPTADAGLKLLGFGLNFGYELFVLVESAGIVASSSHSSCLRIVSQPRSTYTVSCGIDDASNIFW